MVTPKKDLTMARESFAALSQFEASVKLVLARESGATQRYPRLREYSTFMKALRESSTLTPSSASNLLKVGKKLPPQADVTPKAISGLDGIGWDGPLSTLGLGFSPSYDNR